MAAAAVAAATVALTGPVPAAAQPPPTRPALPPPGCEANFAIAVDDSGSITADDFESSRIFVNDLLTATAARSPAARFSLVTFGSFSTELVRGVGAPTARAAMAAHEQSRTGTNIADALTAAAATLGGSPTGASRARALILLTDGQSDAAEAVAAAVVAKAEGISIVTIAVGDGADRPLLARLASTPALAFGVNQGGQLPGLVGRLVSTTCAVVAPPPSPVVAEPKTPAPAVGMPAAGAPPSPAPSVGIRSPPVASPAPIAATPAPSPAGTPALREGCSATDFGGFYRGAPVRAGGGWTLKVTRGTGPASAAAAAPDVSAAFNTSSPPAADADLGTPGVCDGGPGVGAGGAAGRPGANCEPRGMVVIADAGPDVGGQRRACAAACGPASTVGRGGGVAAAAACAAACQGDDWWGGATFVLRFETTDPVTVADVTMLDVDEGEGVALAVVGAAVGGPDELRMPGLGANAIQTLTTKGAMVVPPGGGLRIRCDGSCALVQVRWCGGRV